jgi:hypothetical protein
MKRAGLISSLALTALVLCDVAIAAGPSDVGGFSAAKPDKAPRAERVRYDEVFVKQNPKKPNEARTIKEAYEKLRAGGVIYLTEENTDLTDDGKGMVVDKPFTLAQDAALVTLIDRNGEGKSTRTSRVTVFGAANGTCLSVEMDDPDSPARNTLPKNEVTLRNIKFEARTTEDKRVEAEAKTPEEEGTCLRVKLGSLVLDNVEIAVAPTDSKNIEKGFRTGVHVEGGQVTALRDFRAEVTRYGLLLEGGAADFPNWPEFKGLKKGSTSDLTLAGACEGERSIGIYAKPSKDRRLADARAFVIGAQVDGFDVGVCALGEGSRFENSLFGNNQIGLVAEAPVTVKGSTIFNNSVAGVVINTENSEFAGNAILLNEIGAAIGPLDAPVFNGNTLAFNKIATKKIDGPISNRRPQKDFISNLSGNIAACNAQGGEIVHFARFRKANKRKHNAEKSCAGETGVSYCMSLRGRCAIVGNQCGAVVEPITGGLPDACDNYPASLRPR